MGIKTLNLTETKIRIRLDFTSGICEIRVIAPLFFVLLFNLRFELQSDVILTGSL